MVYGFFHMVQEKQFLLSNFPSSCGPVGFFGLNTMAPIKKYKNGACFSRPVFVSLSHLERGVFSPLMIVYFTSWKVVE